jgi:hypothetical protein
MDLNLYLGTEGASADAAPTDASLTSQGVAGQTTPGSLPAL